MLPLSGEGRNVERAGEEAREAAGALWRYVIYAGKIKREAPELIDPL